MSYLQIARRVLIERRHGPAETAIPVAAALAADAGVSTPVGKADVNAPESATELCRCGSTAYLDVPIHDGQSIRRDCGRCRRFLGWPLWYGSRGDDDVRFASAVTNWPADFGPAADFVMLIVPSDLPAAPFRLRPHSVVVDAAKYLGSLQADVRRGPGGPRARYGALQHDLRRLSEAVVGHAAKDPGI